jgi:hypothetical protein
VNLPIGISTLGKWYCPDRPQRGLEEQKAPHKGSTNVETTASLLKQQQKEQNSNGKGQKKILKTIFTSDTHSWLYLTHDACLQCWSKGLLERVSLLSIVRSGMSGFAISVNEEACVYRGDVS